MNYCKITTEKQAMLMPNPFRLVVANPTDEQKKDIAHLDNWLEMVYTEQPTYDPDTEYLVQTWEDEVVEGVHKAVQHWEVKQIEPETVEVNEEPTDEVEE